MRTFFFFVFFCGNRLPFFFFLESLTFHFLSLQLGESENMYKLRPSYVARRRDFFSLGGEKKRFVFAGFPYVCMYVCYVIIHRGFSAPQKRKRPAFDKGDLLGSAYAPLVGGALTDRVTWRWWHVRFFYHYFMFFFGLYG